MSESIILNEDAISKLLSKLAKQFCESISSLDNVVFIGILSHGFPLAERLAKLIATQTGVIIPVGNLDVALYRDDLLLRDQFVTVRESDIPFDITGKHVVLVDDVLYHGRTIRAALHSLLDYGRTSRIDLMVLIDRGHRRLPICPQYVGKVIKTTDIDHVQTKLLEIDGIDEIIVTNIEKNPPLA